MKMYQSPRIKDIFNYMIAGNIVIAPLDVGYALLFTEPNCMNKIYEIKKRSKDRPLVCLGDEEIIKMIFVNVDKALSYSKLAYPLGLIGIFKQNLTIISEVNKEIYTKDGKIGIFVNMGEFANKLVKFARERGKIIFGSSANVSGNGNHFEVKYIEQEIKNKVKYIFDYGKVRYSEFDKNSRGIGSTIIDIEDNKILRNGLFWESIKRDLAS